MKDYFILQITRINRKMKEEGINPFLGYLLGFVIFGFLSEYFFQKTDFTKYLMILICLALQFKLSEKNRADFLLSTFGDKTKNKIRVLENLCICIPFIFMLLYKIFFIESSILLVLSILLALFSFKSTFNFSIPTPFSKNPFEFSVGFRKTFFIFPIAYTFTIISINVDNINLGVFSMLLIFLTILSYYAKPEQEYYVWIHADSPRAFLKNKIIVATKYATLLVIPILVSLIVFYPTDFKLILQFFLIGVLFLWTIILAKYSAYPREMSLPEGIMIAFSLYFPLLLFAIIPYFYNKSIKKLKTILND